MRTKLRQLVIKATLLSGFWWRILFLLTLGVMLKSMTLGFWDIGSVSTLVTTNRAFHIGIDFLGVAVLLSLIGTRIWVLERQKGYNATRITGYLIVLMTAVLTGWEMLGWTVLIDAAFMLKYIFWIVLSTLFWSVAGRFLPIRFDSLKFAVVFCMELLGFALAGGITLLADYTPTGALISALFCLMGFMIVLKCFSFLAPLPQETFIKRTDGIRDVFEKPLVLGILALSFGATAAKALCDAVLYMTLASDSAASPVTILALVWLLFGLMGLVMVIALYHTRYIYTTLVGTLVLGATVISVGLAGLTTQTGLIATTYFVLLLGSYFYLGGYLQILPRPLSHSIGPRLKKMRYAFADPLGFVFAGSVLLNASTRQIAADVLIGTGIVLTALIIWSAYLYSGILLRLFKMRLWHGGPLMIALPRLTRYLNDMIRGDKADDAIYALRTLEIANHPGYTGALVKSLRHPSAEVRIFALRKMQRLYRASSFQTTLKHIFEKDKDITVRNQALTNLILLAAGQGPQATDPYLPYLENRTLKYGATAGFLKIGGDGALAAMDVLQQLARSKRPKENIAALRLMAEAPSPAFVRLIGSLLKSPSPDVVRQALLTAGATRNPQLLAAVFKSLEDPLLQEEALTALHHYGKAAFPPLEKILTSPQTSTALRKTLILFLGALPSGEGKQLLLRTLGIDNPKLKKTIVQNILDAGIVWIRRDKKEFLRKCIKHDIERVTWLIHLRETYMDAPTHEAEEAFGFLQRAVQEEIDDTRELILYQLLLLETNPMFGRAVRILLGTDYEHYLPALGMIQDLLPGRLYHKLKPILILPLGAHKKENRLSGLSTDEAAAGLSGILLNPPFQVNHWVRATALYALRRLGADTGLAAAVQALQDPHPVVLEAAVWTLVRLQPDKKTLHRELLTVPTSRLAQLPLDDILES